MMLPHCGQQVAEEASGYPIQSGSAGCVQAEADVSNATPTWK